MKMNFIKFNLFAKFFLAFFITCILIGGMIFYATFFNLRNGFIEYQHSLEDEKLQKLITKLQELYQKEQNWNFLRDHKQWRTITINALEDNPEEMLKNIDKIDKFEKGHRPLPNGDFGRHFPPPDDIPFLGAPPPPRERLPIHEGREPYRHFDDKEPRPKPNPNNLGLPLRTSLLDENKKMIVESPFNNLAKDERKEPVKTNNRLLEIKLENKTIGWLSVASFNVEVDKLASSFLAQQQKTNLLSLLLIFLVAALCALLFTRQFLTPIRQIAQAARSLGSGNYQTRIHLNRQDELNQLANDFNTLAHTLESNEQARRQWIADISHELRTPLAILRGEIEATQDGIRQLTPETLKSLHAEVMGLSKLVDDLYELALSDLGALDYRKEPLNIVELLNDVLLAFEYRFKQKNINIDNQLPTFASYLVDADMRRLIQLFNNLLENSLRYTYEAGQLQTLINIKEQSIEILLQDSPPAVPDEALPRLFERLFRVDKARTRALGGAGLGLAICHNIVEAHNGTLTAYHSPLGGLGICITFPLYEA